MTFASHDFRATAAPCDCDECGVNVHIPPPILAALRERKRQKLEQGPFKRTQVRKLLERGPDNVALWHWLLPQGAEPLVEFGSSHRLVWVQRLPERNIMRSIGKGIIGSSDEERSRKDMGWEEGGVYLVPSNGGKAVGWIHHADSSDEDDAAKKTNEGHVELCIAKLPLDRLKDVRFLEDIETSLPPWVVTLIEHCRKGIEKIGEPNAIDTYACHKYSNEDSSVLKEALSHASEPSRQESERIIVPLPDNPVKSDNDMGKGSPASS
jgi:hypothetical protein